MGRTPTALVRRHSGPLGAGTSAPDAVPATPPAKARSGPLLPSPAGAREAFDDSPSISRNSRSDRAFQGRASVDPRAHALCSRAQPNYKPSPAASPWPHRQVERLGQAPIGKEFST